jgi:hypothetical protein
MENTITISAEKGWNIDKLFDILKKYAKQKEEKHGVCILQNSQ